MLVLTASLSGAILTNILLNLELSEKYNKQNQLISVAKFFCQKSCRPFPTHFLDFTSSLAHLPGPTTRLPMNPVPV